jgi:hypothetical protein
MRPDERPSVKDLRVRWNVLIIVLALATAPACQLLIPTNSSNQRQTSGLTLSNGSLDFGNVVVGGSKTLSVTVINGTSFMVSLVSAGVSSAEFSLTSPSMPATIAAGQSIPLSISFKPSATGSASAKIIIASNASEIVLPLSATGVLAGQLSASPSTLTFGNVKVGESATKTETFTNSGASSLTISQATVSGAGFQMSGLTLPLTLSPGQSTSFSVVFTPQTSGSASGTITAGGSASLSTSVRFVQTSLNTSSSTTTETVSVNMSGMGTTSGVLAVAPASRSFGNVQVGTSQSQAATLTNSGGTSLTISQAKATGAGFSLSGLTTPLTLAAGQSANFNVVFAPQATGSVTGNIAILSDASNPTLNLPLSGTGVSAGSLAANPSSHSFGNVQIGSNSTFSETLTNSGGTSVTISQATATGAGFSVSGLSLPVTLTAGQSKTFSVVFAPSSAGSVSGNLAILNNGPNPTLNIALSGTGVTPGALSPNPSSLSFGSVPVSNSKTLSETVKNTGGSSLTISQATASGTGFSISGLNPPITLTAGQSFTFSASFAPTSAASANGTISVVSNGSNPNLTISMSGTGTAAGQLGVSPASLSFGNVVTGGNASLSGTLNATSASVTVSSASISNSEFSLSGLTFPFTIAAGGSANFTVSFSPSATGLASGTLSFSSNASNSPAAQSLSGTGTTPPQHSVNLSWNASTSAVVGYNVYRGTASGGPYSRVNSGLDALTAYTDGTVQAGQTYYYVTTSVDGSNSESTYSNEVKAIVPTP